MGDCLGVLEKLYCLLHLKLFLLIIFFLICFKNFLNSVQWQENLISSFFQLFQTCHNFQQFVNIFCNWFVSNLYGLFGVFQEFSDLLKLRSYIIVQQSSIEFISLLCITLCYKWWNEFMTSDVFFFLIFFVSDLDFTFTFIRYFVSYCISSIFVVDNFSLNVNLINDGLLFGSFSI